MKSKIIMFICLFFCLFCACTKEEVFFNIDSYEVYLGEESVLIDVNFSDTSTLDKIIYYGIDYSYSYYEDINKFEKDKSIQVKSTESQISLTSELELNYKNYLSFVFFYIYNDEKIILDIYYTTKLIELVNYPLTLLEYNIANAYSESFVSFDFKTNFSLDVDFGLEIEVVLDNDDEVYEVGVLVSYTKFNNIDEFVIGSTIYHYSSSEKENSFLFTSNLKNNLDKTIYIRSYYIVVSNYITYTYYSFAAEAIKLIDLVDKANNDFKKDIIKANFGDVLLEINVTTFIKGYAIKDYKVTTDTKGVSVYLDPVSYDDTFIFLNIVLEKEVCEYTTLLIDNKLISDYTITDNIIIYKIKDPNWSGIY